MSKFLFRDGTLNLPYNMASNLKMQDLKTALSHGVDIIGLQEIQTKAAKKVVKKFLRRHPLWGVRWGGECPILFKRTKFAIWYHNVFETDPGKHGVNPRRVINMIGVEHRKSKNTFFYANHHAEHEYTPNHAHSSNYNYKVAAARRGLEKLKSLGAERVGGDLNALATNHAEVWYPSSLSQTYTLKSNGLDYIGWRKFHVRNKQVIPVHSDHNLLLVDVCE